jgi:DNA-binding PadR family transcriptional regulator
MRSAIAYVILGALRSEPRSGYEIKQLVDRSTRFFWAASYGQIYPELRRLQSDGLIEVAGNGNNGRRRVRYRLTEAGREELVDWLRGPELRYELRDEGLLKLFFADALEPRDALELVRSFRAQRQATLDRLRGIETGHKAKVAAGLPGIQFHGIVLDYGLEFYGWAVDWSSRLERRLEAELIETEGVS